MPAPSRPAGRALDALNFFLADVQTGLGPYLAIYLLTVEHWNEANIGLVMTIAGLASLACQTPAGALIDATRRKRAVIVVAAVLVTGGSLLLPFVSGFFVVAGIQSAVQIAGDVFPPAVAAIALGIFGPARFTRRNGRNQAFNHAGNAVAALIIAGAALLWGPMVVFPIMAVMAVASIVAALMIPAAAIDHDVARGLRGEEAHGGDRPSGFRVLLTCRPLLIFAACVLLFHLANAYMLSLVGQELALQNKKEGTALMSAAIIIAQFVMVFMAALVAAKADKWGRKPIFLAAFLILPIRGVLFTLSDNPYWLLGVQALDGVGAGIYGALFPIVVEDLTRGTGRFNVSQGAITTAQGIGASISNTLGGFVLAYLGFHAAFLTLAGVAAAGFLLFFFLMPETEGDRRPADRTAAVAAAVRLTSGEPCGARPLREL